MSNTKKRILMLFLFIGMCAPVMAQDYDSDIKKGILNNNITLINRAINNQDYISSSDFSLSAIRYMYFKAGGNPKLTPLVRQLLDQDIDFDRHLANATKDQLAITKALADHINISLDDSMYSELLALALFLGNDEIATLLIDKSSMNYENGINNVAMIIAFNQVTSTAKSTFLDKEYLLQGTEVLQQLIASSDMDPSINRTLNLFKSIVTEYDFKNITRDSEKKIATIAEKYVQKYPSSSVVFGAMGAFGGNFELYNKYKNVIQDGNLNNLSWNLDTTQDILGFVLLMSVIGEVTPNILNVTPDIFTILNDPNLNRIFLEDSMPYDIRRYYYNYSGRRTGIVDLFANPAKNKTIIEFINNKKHSEFFKNITPQYVKIAKDMIGNNAYVNGGGELLNAGIIATIYSGNIELVKPLIDSGVFMETFGEGREILTLFHSSMASPFVTTYFSQRLGQETLSKDIAKAYGNIYKQFEPYSKKSEESLQYLLTKFTNPEIKSDLLTSAALYGNINYVSRMIKLGYLADMKDTRIIPRILFNMDAEQGPMNVNSLLENTIPMIKNPIFSDLKPIRKNYQEILKLLQKNFPNINIRGEDGSSPLQYVQTHNMLTNMLKMGYYPFIFNVNGETPLYYADSSVKASYMNIGLNFDRDDKWNRIQRATTIGDIDYLYDNVDKIHFYGNSGQTVFAQAVSMGHENIAQFALNQGVSPLTSNVFGATPLHYAAANNNYTMVSLILKQKGDKKILFQKDNLGKYPWQLTRDKKLAAYLFFRQYLIQILLAILALIMGITLSFKKSSKMPNFSSIIKKQIQNMRHVFSGIKINKEGKMFNKIGDVFKKVIASDNINDDISKVDVDGNTLAHQAVLSENPEMLQYFLDNKINMFIKNDDGYTPFTLALKNNQERLAKQIIKSNPISKDGDNLLHYSIITGDLECVKFLIQAEFDFTTPNRQKQTPLDLARMHEQDSIRDLIKEAIKNSR